MTSEAAEAVKDAVPVPQVLEALGIELPARIPGHISCHWHDENTPSLWIAESRWWCFGCGVGGDVITLVRHVTGCNFTQALQLLEGMEDLLDYKTPAVQRTEREVLDLTDKFESEAEGWGPDALLFVEEKWPHLGWLILRSWGVRPGGRGRYLMIPHTYEGRITGIKTRAVSGPHKGEKKAFSGSTYHELYKVDAHPSATQLLLVEGESDTWTMSARYAEHNQVQVAGLPSGAQSWKRHLKEMRQYPGGVLVALDADDTGDRVSNEIIEELGPRLARRMRPIGYKDWTDRAVANHE